MICNLNYNLLGCHSFCLVCSSSFQDVLTSCTKVVLTFDVRDSNHLYDE